MISWTKYEIQICEKAHPVAVQQIALVCVACTLPHGPIKADYENDKQAYVAMLEKASAEWSKLCKDYEKQIARMRKMFNAAA